MVANSGWSDATVVLNACRAVARGVVALSAGDTAEASKRRRFGLSSVILGRKFADYIIKNNNDTTTRQPRAERAVDEICS